MRMLTRVGLAAVALAVGAAEGRAQDFEWRGSVDRGDAVEIKGINGGIEASAASGAQVVVTAVKKGRRSDADEVRIDVVEHAGGVTLCAVYPESRGRKNECAPGDEGHLSSRDNDVQVDFRVQVPAGVRFVGSTVNGEVRAQDLDGDVVATTVNGGVDVSTRGMAKANTVNGSIRASMGRADWTGDLRLETVNGGITVELPADIGADVQASTVNGGMETDFPLTVTGKFSNRKMRGTIGGGGRGLHLKTVNGSIRLKRQGG